MIAPFSNELGETTFGGELTVDTFRVQSSSELFVGPGENKSDRGLCSLSNSLCRRRRLYADIDAVVTSSLAERCAVLRFNDDEIPLICKHHRKCSSTPTPTHSTRIPISEQVQYIYSMAQGNMPKIEINELLVIRRIILP